MTRCVTVSTCSLNQWALDFHGNLTRILDSIQKAKAGGSRLRVGPELEIPGYGCNDHFWEVDTVRHSWEVLARILEAPEAHDILLDLGMPVRHRGVTYNARIIALNSKIVLVRPKLCLANDGNYREARWFTPWHRRRHVESFLLPTVIEQTTGQRETIIGDGLIRTLDALIGAEMCEEMFAPINPGIRMGLAGVDIFINSSASHHQLGKLRQRIMLMKSTTSKVGGLYLYSNAKGCDGERVMYDGGPMILVNGRLVQMGNQFTLDEVEVLTETIDLDDVDAFKISNYSLMNQAAAGPPYPEVRVPFSLASQASLKARQTHVSECENEFSLLSKPQEIARGPALWMWDYLRRSGASGFFLPLSGGLDSCCVALIVFSMCRILSSCGDDRVLDQVRRVLRDPSFVFTSEKELCGRIFHTAYLATEHSSSETRLRAKLLSEAIGSRHMEVEIDRIVNAVVETAEELHGKEMRFSARGGSPTENLALQNIQARIRMVMSYLLAQTGQWAVGKVGGLLVLGSANVDECLRGYLTKYDCSSADINPIGGIGKADLRSFVQYAQQTFGLDILKQFLEATPTAELEPITPNYTQSDEVDMGVTYEELTVFGLLRKVYKCGPVSMFGKLLSIWSHLGPTTIAHKVFHFFRTYAINRHKMTVATPSYHAEDYSPEDNRFDLRPFLYNANWTWQFSKIEEASQEAATGRVGRGV